MNQGLVLSMTDENDITDGDVLRNTDWMAYKKAKKYNKETFLDVILKRATRIIRRHVTRPQYSSYTRDNICELLNELNRLKTAVEREKGQ